MPVAVVAEHGLARVDTQVDTAATAAVAAIGTAARHVRLTTKAGCTVAAVAGTDGDRHFIEKHQSKSYPSRRCRRLGMPKHIDIAHMLILHTGR